MTVRRLVTFVITRLDVGGAQQTVLELCRGLDPARFRPLVVAGTDLGSGGTLVPEIEATGAAVHLLPELVSAVRPGSDVRAVAALSRLFERVRPDVVHTHSSKAGVVGRLAARAARTPAVVHTVHGWSFHDRMPAPARLAFRRVERALARGTDALVVVSEADRQTGLAVGIGRPDQYACIRSGVDLRSISTDRASARTGLGLPTEAPVVGFVGRLAPQKDPSTLLRAFVRVHGERPDARLVIVGEGPLRAELERAAQRAGVAAQVLFAGSRRDVPDLLAAFDVMALPSRWEGMPRVLVEAAAAGVPVVATPVGGVTDFIDHGSTGMLVPAGDDSSLAGALVHLVDDGADRSRLAAGAGMRAAAFSAGEMVAATERLYAHLLGDRTPVAVAA